MRKSLGRTDLETHRLAQSLATLGEPGAHGFRQALGLDAKTGFQEAFGKRQCVIKLGFSGEVAHTKIVKPLEGTGTALGAYNDFDAQLLSVHDDSIACRPR